MNESAGKVPAESGQRLVSVTHFVSHVAGSTGQMVRDTPSTWSTDQFRRAFVLSGDVGLIHRFLFGGAEVKRKAEMTANEPKERELEWKALRQGGNYWSRGRDSDATLYVFSTPPRDSAPILSFQSCIIAFFFLHVTTATLLFNLSQSQGTSGFPRLNQFNRRDHRAHATSHTTPPISCLSLMWLFVPPASFPLICLWTNKLRL